MTRDTLIRLSQLAAACTLAAASCAALSQPATGATTTAPPAQGNTAGAARVEPLSRADRKFIEEAAQGGMAEVEHGKLAEQRAASPQVKQFGQRMVQDHTKAGDELKVIAGARGVTPPATMEKKHHREMEKLSKLSGAEFDRQYMKHMVDAHKQTVSLFEKQAKSGKDGDLKSYAIKTLPTLKEHLAQAQSTHDAVKGAK